jgi:predicted HTH transcriptional regulator
MIIPKKNDDFIKALIKRGEGENLDFKLAINNPQKIAKMLAAFANTSGGIILVGINDQRKIIGVDVEEEMHMVDLANATFLSPSQGLQYEVYEIAADYGESEEDVNLLLIKVDKFENPCFFKSPDGNLALYHRIGDRNAMVPMPSDPDLPQAGN